MAARAACWYDVAPVPGWYMGMPLLLSMAGRFIMGIIPGIVMPCNISQHHPIACDPRNKRGIMPSVSSRHVQCTATWQLQRYHYDCIIASKRKVAFDYERPNQILPLTNLE